VSKTRAHCLRLGPRPGPPLLLAAATVALVAPAIASGPARADAALHPAAACCSSPERFWRACVVTRTSADTLTVRFADGGSSGLALATNDLRNAAAGLRRPDEALVAVGHDGDPHALVAIGAQVSGARRLTVTLAVALGLLGLAVLLLGGQVRALTLGLDGLHSGSTWQMLMWFTVVVTAYGATIVLRTWAGGIAYASGVSIPPRLLAQAGLSAFTFAGARAIRHLKEGRAAARRRAEADAARIAGVQAGGATSPAREAEAPAPPRASFPADLVRGEGTRPDPGNFQLVVVTLIAVSIYLVRVFAWLGQVELTCAASLPELDLALLGATSVGYGAYLAKKAASPLGGG